MPQLRLAIALVVLASCGGGANSASIGGPKPVIDPPKVLTRVQLSLPATLIIVGDTMVVTADGIDQNGAPMSIGAVSWTTSSPAVATASPSGVVHAVAPGTTTVTAAVGALQGSAALTIIPVPVARVTIAPALLPLGLGSSKQLVANARDDAGNVLAERIVTWASSATTVATVSASGLVTATGTGTATVTAASGGKSATAGGTSARTTTASGKRRTSTTSRAA